MSCLRIVNARQEAMLYPLATQGMWDRYVEYVIPIVHVDSIRNGSTGNGNIEN